jgi:hypothetical protein
MSRWTINSYTFIATGSTRPWTITLQTLDLTDYFLSGTLTLTVDETSKVVFTIPYMQGKDLYQGQTLIDVKYGNDRKFFGTIAKKTYDSLSGIYTFEVTGVLGTYQFLPNYDNYGVDTIENYLATEMSRFKGTASAPYDIDNPWTELYTGHNEIPSTFGDIVTENLSLIPSFNLNIQKTSASAYDFIKLITRQKSYVIPQAVTPKSALHLFEKAEKIYFKRITEVNTQEVKYNDNLTQFVSSLDTPPSRVRAYNTVDQYPQYGGYDYGKYPVPFYYKRVNLSQKTDGSGYSTSTEIADEASRLVSESRQMNFEVYAYDKHLLDESVPWIDIDKKVKVTYRLDGNEVWSNFNVTQITYDLVDATKSRIKLGNLKNSFTAGTEQDDRDFEAALKDRLQTSGGTMTGDIAFKDSSSVVGDSKFTIRDRIFGTCNHANIKLLKHGAISAQGEELDTEPYLTQYVKLPFMPVLPNESYTASYQSTNATQKRMNWFEFDSQGNFLRLNGTNFVDNTVTFQTGANTAFVRLQYNNMSGDNPTTTTIEEFISIQLESGTTKSAFVPHALDNVELTKKSGWSYKGDLTSAIAFDADDTELLIVPTVYGIVFQGGHYIIDTLQASPLYNEFYVNQDTTFGFTMTFYRSGYALVLNTKDVRGWDANQVRVLIYTK